MTEDLANSLNNDTSNSGFVRMLSTIYPYSHPDNVTETDDTYNEVVQKTWPSVITFQYEEDNIVRSFTTVRCLRARDIAAGSETPVPLEGAAAVPGISVAFVMGLSLAAVFVVWM